MYLAKYSKKLHPNNVCMVRVKNKLAGFYGRLPGYTMLDMTMNRELLDRKQKLCEEALDVVDKLEPGLSSTKGKDGL